MRTRWNPSWAWAVGLILVAASAGAQPAVPIEQSVSVAAPAAPEVEQPTPALEPTTPEVEQPGSESGEPPSEVTPNATQTEESTEQRNSARRSGRERRRTGNSVVRVGDSYVVRAGEIVDEVVVVAGSATIEGEVVGDAVVVAGTARLASTAIVGGDFVVVGGVAVIEPGAVVDRDVVVVGGDLDAPPGFSPGGEQVAVGFMLPGVDLGAVGPWFAQGLLWGRPFVPSLTWVWAVVGIVFLIYLIVNIVFERPVRACSEILAEKPLTTGLAGFLVLLLIGPVSFILMVSVVGIVVVPFLMIAILIGALLGRIGVVRWMGSRVVAEAEPVGWGQATRSLTIGFVIVSLAYMVPVIGFVTWAVLGVLGLGAATMTFVSAMRRELPESLEPPPPPVPSGPPTPPPRDAASEQLAVEAAPEAADVPTPSAATRVDNDVGLLRRATFPSRAGAVALDLLLVWIATALLALDGARAFFFLVLVYHIVFWGWQGTTIGGLICRLRVVRTDGAPIRFTEAVVRGLSSIFSVAVVGLGWFWAIRDAEGQAWHDRIAGTYVVSVPPNSPLP